MRQRHDRTALDVDAEWQINIVVIESCFLIFVRRQDAVVAPSRQKLEFAVYFDGLSSRQGRHADGGVGMAAVCWAEQLVK